MKHILNQGVMYMKPVIGIISRNNLSESKKPISIVYQDIEKSIIKSGALPIGISNKYFNQYLSLCDGFILQGGSETDPLNLSIIKKIHDLNIPLLGICLGMQEMALTYQGIEKNISHHQNTYHQIYIYDQTLLYKIINKPYIVVNSRHHTAIKNPKLTISAKSNDNIIEAIEDTHKLFFLGLQFHPENLYQVNSSSKKIFDYFVKMCHYYKENMKRGDL